jgi:rare lipoprotein A
MKTMTTSMERKRLTVGGLLIAASVAIGAGSDAFAPELDVDAPLLAPFDAAPPADSVQPAGGHDAPTPPDVPSKADAPVVDDVATTRDTEETPVEEALLVLEGGASWYADALAGRRTASGEPYDPTELIAAHRALPFGTRLRVTNLANDRSVEVRVIDRGPFVGGRILDVSRSAAEQLGIVRAGHGRVRVEVLEYGAG